MISRVDDGGFDTASGLSNHATGATIEFDWTEPLEEVAEEWQAATMKVRCPFCYSEVGAKAVCKGKKPGAFGLKHLSPGVCGSTPEMRETEEKRRAELAKTQRVEYERDLHGVG